jgi:hypothetical protein
LSEPTGNRLSFLHQTCRNDEEHFAEVKSLLEASADTEPLIEQNGFNLASKIGSNGRTTILQSLDATQLSGTKAERFWAAGFRGTADKRKAKLK